MVGESIDRQYGMVVHSTTDEEDKERAEELVVEYKNGVGMVFREGASRQLLMCFNMSHCKCDHKDG